MEHGILITKCTNSRCHQMGKIVSANKCNECYRLLSFAICLHCGIALFATIDCNSCRSLLHKPLRLASTQYVASLRISLHLNFCSLWLFQVCNFTCYNAT